jgi:hypothetical protein
VFVAGLWVPVNHDEAWFLQVLERVSHGDVLHTDVFYGAGPLPVWAAWLAVRLIRPQGLVLRALDAVYFATQLACGGWLLTRAGVGAEVIALVWVAAVALAGPTWSAGGHYSATACVAVLGAAGAVLELPDGGVGWLVVAGAGVGAAAASKQSVGMAAGAGFAVVVAVEGSASQWGALVVGAAAMFGACLLPVLLAGALRGYIREGYTNKSVYLAAGRISPWAGWRGARGLCRGQPIARRLGLALNAAVFAVPVLLATATLAGIAVVVAGDAPSARLTAQLALVLIGVAVAGMYPRTDAPHVQAMTPISLVALALVGQAVAAGTGLTFPAGVGGLLLAAVAAVMAFGLAVSLDTVHRNREPSGLVNRAVPHFRGLPVTGYHPGGSPASPGDLRRLTDGTVFLLRPDAALWYLAADLVNPTPYDYPYCTVFGPGGEGRTVERIKSGDVTWVCLPGPSEGPLRPHQLEEFVLGSMTAVAATPAGSLYRLPSTGKPPSQ